jgi:hypothetical protein
VSRGIRRRDQVRHFGVIDECLVSVRATSRHVELPTIRVAQFHATPFQVGGRFGSQVDDHVPYRPATAPDQFYLLGRGDLIVKSAYGRFVSAPRDVRLDELRDQSTLGKLGSAKHAREKSPFVGAALEVDDPAARQTTLGKNQRGAPRDDLICDTRGTNVHAVPMQCCLGMPMLPLRVPCDGVPLA